MLPVNVAKAFGEWLSRRGAAKAGSTWSHLLPYVNEPPNTCYQKTYESFRDTQFKGYDSVTCQREFTHDLHNLESLVKAWVFEPGPTAGFPALRLSIKKRSRSIVIATTDRLLKTPDQGAEELVEAFYDAIRGHRYLEAWGLLSPDFQKRVWPKGFKNGFEPGYSTYHGHRFFQKAVVESTEGSAKIDVFYEEDQFPPHMSALHELGHLFVKDADLVPAKIAGIREALVELGADIDKLDEIPIRRFFEADALIAIPFLVGIPSTTMAAACPPDAHPYVMHRARRLYCIWTTDDKETTNGKRTASGKWLIDRIEPLIPLIPGKPTTT